MITNLSGEDIKMNTNICISWFYLLFLRSKFDIFDKSHLIVYIINTRNSKINICPEMEYSYRYITNEPPVVSNKTVKYYSFLRKLGTI